MITLDGNDLKEFDLKVLENHDNPLLTNTRDNLIQIPGMHGVHDMGSDLGAKYFYIPMGFRPQKDYAELRYKANQFVKFLLDDYGKPREMKLVFDYLPNRYWKVKYSGQIPLQRLISMGRFELPLTAADPFATSNIETSDINWDSETISFDDDYLFINDFVQGERITSNKTLNVTAHGFAIRPTLLINGSAEQVTFQCNGKSFSLDSFSNSEIEINGENYTVTKNGVNAFMDIEGDFLELLPGQNKIEITGTGMDFTLSIPILDKFM